MTLKTRIGKPITLQQMRYRIEELYLAGITQEEYNNMKYLAYDFIPNNKCKKCKKRPIQIFSTDTSFICIFECEECEKKVSINA